MNSDELFRNNLGLARYWAGRVAWRYGPPADYEECYAAALEGLWRASATYDPARGTFGAWGKLYCLRYATLAARFCHAPLRRGAVRLTPKLAAGLGRRSPPPAPEVLVELISPLDGKVREAVRLRYAERLSCGEIAGRLGYASRQSASEMIRRAVRKLRLNGGR